MSVAIPVIDHVDPDARRIYLKAGVRQIHMMDDIYFEMRNLRRVDESLRGWYLFCEGGGNVQKTATTYTPRYLTMLTDPRDITTKIVPANDVDHTLVVKGEVITDQGTSNSAAFDKTGLAVNVDIEFEPPGAEIIRLDQALIEFSSFAGYIHVDINGTIAGTGYYNDVPIGSPLAPVNNWADAHTIAMARGIPQFLVYNNTTIATQDFSAGGSMKHTFRAVSPFIEVTVADSADVTGADFYNMTLMGQLDGINVVRECSIGPITEASGIFENCAFWSTVDLSGDTSVFNCYSQVVGNGAAIVNPWEWDIIVRGFKGSLHIGNTAAGHVSSIGVSEGRINLLAGVTEGELHLRGEPYDITDGSSGNAVVIDETGSKCERDIKAKTDDLTFTKANELDVNVKSNNDAEVYGSGTSGDLWRGTP